MKTLLAFFLMVLPLAVFADSKNPDLSFFENLAQGGIAEVEAGQLALKKATSQGARDFASMMVKDHSAANEKLKALAKSKNIKLPAEPSVMQKAKLKKLEMYNAANFDKEYIEGQIKDHEDTVKLLKKEIAEGKDAEAKAFASQILPTVEDHLTRVKKLAAGDASAAKHH